MLLLHLRPPLPRFHNRIQFHCHIRGPVSSTSLSLHQSFPKALQLTTPPNAEHHLRSPPRHNSNPRPRHLPPNNSGLRSRQSRLHLQHLVTPASSSDRNIHMFPTRATCYDKQYELYARDTVWTVYRHHGTLVHEGQEICRAKD